MGGVEVALDVECPPAKVAPTPSEQQAASADAPHFESNLRVLIADDQMTNRRLLHRVFSKYFGAGWVVTEATTAEEALALATASDFALVVMDEIFAQGQEAMLGSAAIRQ